MSRVAAHLDRQQERSRSPRLACEAGGRGGGVPCETGGREGGVSAGERSETIERMLDGTSMAVQ
jgi:hypothetical protein